MRLPTFTPTASQMGLSLIPLLLLAGCGGGSGSGGNAQSGSPVGRFDGPVTEGLRYVTETATGFTDAAGQFSYKPGESVSFYVGDVQIGETIPAKASIAVHELIPGATLYTENADAYRYFLDEFSTEELVAFRKLHNTLSLLYSADADAIPSNGIQLEPELHEFFADLSIPFEEEIEYFGDLSEESGVLHRALIQAFNVSLVQYGAVLKPMRALDVYYNDRGIQAPFSVTGTIEYDYEADGIVDEIEPARFGFDEKGELNYDERYSYTRDAWGNITTRSRDRSDGILNPAPTRIDQFAFNDYGQELSETVDTDADGTPDFASTRIYDDRGNVIRSEQSNDYPRPTSIQVLRYDSDDRIIERSIDSDANGVIDEISSSSYDQFGNRIFETTDSNADGIPDSSTERTFNSDGQLTMLSIDSDGDGQPNRIFEFAYDENGNVVSRLSDSDGDGITDFVELKTYDERNNLLTQWRDNGNDGVPEYTEIATYDLQGNQTSRQTDTDADGTLEVNWIRGYTYDSDGNILSLSYDKDADGDLDEQEFWTYDDQGRVTSLSQDSQGTGAFVIYSWQYDESGNPVFLTADDDGDGSPERSVEQIFASNGAVTARNWDFDDDDDIDYVQQITPVYIGWRGLFTFDSELSLRTEDPRDLFTPR